MSAPVPTSAFGAVFLSYAREDTDAARRIADALRGFGVEVWFDQNELRGGDAWDQKIRRQIKECALFLPLISQRTQDRGEGYFRLEWKLAVERTHQMAEGMPFLAPVAIDDAHEADALVPPEFMRVHWTRLQDGTPTPQFVEQIKRLLAAPRKSTATRKAESAGPQFPSAAAAPPPSTTPAATKSGLPLWVTAALGVAVLALVAYVVIRPGAREPAAPSRPVADAKTTVPAPLANNPSSAAPAAAAKSVAVLAFADLSEAHNSEYLSDGISEELLNVLAKIPDLRVAARTSAFFFKDKNQPIPDIAQKLNVAYVVEGSVQRAGDRVKITAQLINAAGGYHVWSDTFTRDLKDVFAVEEEIAGLIAKNLSVKLGITSATSTAAAPTRNPAAYEAYLRARASQATDVGERGPETVQLYEEALRLDPDYALAWARLADVCARIYAGGFDRSDEMTTKARSAVAAALRLAPNLPEAHLAQARIDQELDYDLKAARRELDLVERLRPNEAEVPAARVRVAYASGQWGDPLAALVARAVEADPQNAATLSAMASVLTSIGRFADAERLCDRASAAGEATDAIIRQKVINLLSWTGDADAALALLDTTPEAARPRTRFYYQRAGLCERRGDLAGALGDYEKFRAAMAENFANRSGPRNVAVNALYSIARIETRLGHAVRAAQLYDETLVENEKLARDFPGLTGPIVMRAFVHARRGQPDAAVALIEERLGIALSAHDVPTILSTRRTKAAILALVGRTDAAVAELRAVHEAGFAFGYGLGAGGDLEPLGANAKFQQLMKECEAEADAQPRPKK